MSYYWQLIACIRPIQCHIGNIWAITVMPNSNSDFSSNYGGIVPMKSFSIAKDLHVCNYYCCCCCCWIISGLLALYVALNLISVSISFDHLMLTVFFSLSSFLILFFALFFSPRFVLYFYYQYAVFLNTCFNCLLLYDCFRSMFLLLLSSSSWSSSSSLLLE